MNWADLFNSLLTARNSLEGTGILFTGIAIGAILGWYITYRLKQATIHQLSSAAKKNFVEIEQISENSKNELNKSFETLAIGLRSYYDAQKNNDIILMDSLREECLNYLNTEVIHSFEKLCSYKKHLCSCRYENHDIASNDVYPVLRSIANTTIELNDIDLLNGIDKTPYLINRSSLRHSLHIFNLPMPMYELGFRKKRWELKKVLKSVLR